MRTITVCLLTIIAEGVLEERLLTMIQQFGARGYTISEVRGKGTRGVSGSFWQGSQIKIETLVSDKVADEIFGHLAEHYFHDYAVVAYTDHVETVRGEKYL
jgi:nitrogen regulatory protein P-II 2